MYGYETWALLNGVFIPAVTADTDLDRNRIDSSGIYGGALSGTGIPIGNVHYYDWPNITASFSADATEGLLDTVRTMVMARHQPVSITLNNSIRGCQQVNQAWWNSIQIQTAEDSLVSVTMNLNALERNIFTVNNFTDYWQDILGGLGGSVSAFSVTGGQIPFWKTQIREFDLVKGWTVSLTQTVNRFMGCFNNSGDTPENPFVLGMGVMNGTISFNTYENPSPDISAMPFKHSGSSLNSRQPITIVIDGNDFMSFGCELNRVNDPLSGVASLSDLNYDYQIYDIL